MKKATFFFDLSQIVVYKEELITMSDNMDYRFEVRRKSFEGCFSELLQTRAGDFASAGFYWTGEGDRTRCFECNEQIGLWDSSEDPIVEHQRWSGRCRFIRNIPCGNVPIGVDPSTIPLPQPRGSDICARYRLEYRLDAVPDSYESAVVDCDNGMTSELMELYKQEISALSDKKSSRAIKVVTPPKFSKFTILKKRLKTFENWDSSAQTGEQLAEAGFFYSNLSDLCICYYCGGGLF